MYNGKSLTENLKSNLLENGPTVNISDNQEKHNKAERSFPQVVAVVAVVAQKQRVRHKKTSPSYCIHIPFLALFQNFSFP